MSFQQNGREAIASTSLFQKGNPQRAQPQKQNEIVQK